MSHVFARCASQKTYGHARIACDSRFSPPLPVPHLRPRSRPPRTLRSARSGMPSSTPSRPSRPTVAAASRTVTAPTPHTLPTPLPHLLTARPSRLASAVTYTASLSPTSLAGADDPGFAAFKTQCSDVETARHLNVVYVDFRVDVTHLPGSRNPTDPLSRAGFAEGDGPAPWIGPREPAGALPAASVATRQRGRCWRTSASGGRTLDTPARPRSPISHGRQLLQAGGAVNPPVF